MENDSFANKKKAKQRKPGSGRTPGSFSFVVLTLSDLTGKFADPNQPIQVGRKWAEMQGFKIQSTTDAKNLYNKIEGTTVASHVDVKVEEL